MFKISGKNLVGFFLKNADLEVIEVGTDKSTEVFMQAVKEHQSDMLGLSALLTTTMLGKGDIVKALDSQGLRPKTKVIISTGPVSARFANHIDADAYALDAVEDVRKIKELVSR